MWSFGLVIIYSSLYLRGGCDYFSPMWIIVTLVRILKLFGGKVGRVAPYKLQNEQHGKNGCTLNPEVHPDKKISAPALTIYGVSLALELGGRP